ncbi:MULTISPECIES: hypothetical protein [Nonomuraea]|uniref:Outer membrane channel protein CpnT-like N-terminal domain-containing protein n=1 Tax=Nonomuraea ferruginea TaxID=46174 RepID=A0ABT4T732_9ACTN|nr:hypothetical protein [Nonomuraea ferruginea]MDA0645306.1 hypothetical protein [Nonomuraea ferruginea]
MSKQEIVTITSYASAPFGDRPCSTSQEINSWLNSTDPAYVRGAGQTYTFASSKVEQAISSLEEHAGRIAQIWKGPDASKARQALQLLHASGQELSTKMQQMGTALQSYAGHLETAREEAKRAPTDAEIDGNHLQGTGAEKPDIEQAAKNMIAQDAIHKLNTEIVTIFDSEVPDYIMYELPTVSLPGTGGGYENPGYPTGSGTRGPTFGSTAYDSSGGWAGAPGGTNPGGTNPGGTNPGGTNPGGSDPGGTNPDGSTPGGTDPNDPGNPNNPDPGSPDPGAPGNQDPSRNPGSGTGDGTAPSVIGNEDRTTTDGGTRTDPRQTDLATVTPQTLTFTPTTLAPVTTTVAPPSVLTPVGSTPGVPSVIGSPGMLGGQSALGAAGRGIGGPMGGMPLMPFMGGAGGAGGGGGDYGDVERTTYLSEDPNSWTTGHDTTEPVIG